MRRTWSFIRKHPLTRHAPLSALLRFARWQVRSRLRSEVEFEWIAGTKLIARRGMTGATGNIYCGLHEFADMAFLLHLLSPEDTFVDVGANVGSYTILSAGVVGAKTIAIEPDPAAGKALRKNVTANALESRVDVIRSAVGSSAGTVEFTVGLDTTNRVAEPGDLYTQVVPIIDLDTLLADVEPTLVKMDVEGFEADVIAGASSTIRKPSLLAILTEDCSDGVSIPLAEAGFQRVYYNPLSRDLTSTFQPDHSNALFVRDRAACIARLRKGEVRTILGTSV